MHVLFRESHGLEETAQPEDLGQSPADLVVLSFSDSDLGAFAAGWQRGKDSLPSLRLANLSRLRHPLSVDTYVEREPTAAEWFAKFTPSAPAFRRYFRSLFPFLDWIFHYNLTWLFGDIVAGKLHSHIILRPQNNKLRRHGRLCCHSTGHGLCSAGSVAGRVRPVH